MRNKPMLFMLACCLIPLAGLAGVYLFGISANSIIFYGMILLCPALHFLMMRGMVGGHHHAEHRPQGESRSVADPAAHRRPAGPSDA